MVCQKLLLNEKLSLTRKSIGLSKFSIYYNFSSFSKWFQNRVATFKCNKKNIWIWQANMLNCHFHPNKLG